MTAAVPKAARTGGDAFAARLGRELSRHATSSSLTAMRCAGSTASTLSCSTLQC